MFNPTSDNANDYVLYPTKFLTGLNDKYFPIRTKLISSKRYKTPWLTVGLMKYLKKKKHGWYRLMKQC